MVVHITVADRRGAYVSGLSRDAFDIFEDGKPQRIDLFSGEDSPVTVGLVVDSSGSMREGRERVIAAATAFAEASNPKDELFALAFNEQVWAALPLSALPEKMRQAMANPRIPSDASIGDFLTALSSAEGAHGAVSASAVAAAMGTSPPADGHGAAQNKVRLHRRSDHTHGRGDRAQRMS